jgi:DNA polymerase-3 subunit alpha
MNYIPLGAHTHFSLLKSCTKPENLAKKLESLQMPRCGITDFHTVSGMVQCIDKFKGSGLSPILGTKIKFGNNPILLAKNMNGWKNILKILSLENITIQDLAAHSEGCIFIAGCDLISIIDNLKEIYKDDLYGNIQLCQTPDIECTNIVREKFPVKKVAVPHSLYLNREDAYDNRILFCVEENTTLAKLNNSLNYYCTGDGFHLPSYEEALAIGYTKEELATTLEIAEKCENIKITGKPILPNYICPQGLDADEYLRELCRNGWKKRIEGKISSSRKEEYVNRIKMELEVLQGVGLSPYFLVVQDILNYVDSQRWLKGPARGSSAGCLTSYLLNITDIDPIPHDLLFERFYNAGRNTADKVTLPDIDIDIPKHKRERIIQYIYNKYGEENCSQIVTFQTLKGRAVVKAVIGSHNDMSFGELLGITEHIPDQAKIADELEQMKEHGETPSIVLWALEHRAEKFKEYARIEDGKIVGPLANRFEQAIRLEGLKTHASRHASGIIIAPSRLENYCQVMRLKDANVCGWEMGDAEAIGLLKLDILGLNTLDKLVGVSSVLGTGDIDDEYGLPD